MLNIEITFLNIKLSILPKKVIPHHRCTNTHQYDPYKEYYNIYISY